MVGQPKMADASKMGFTGQAPYFAVWASGTAAGHQCIARDLVGAGVTGNMEAAGCDKMADAIHQRRR